MYTINLIGHESLFTTKTDTLAEAAFLKLAWEKNIPFAKGSVVVFDQYDYLVPAKELSVGLAIKKADLERQMAYFVE